MFRNTRRVHEILHDSFHRIVGEITLITADDPVLDDDGLSGPPTYAETIVNGLVHRIQPGNLIYDDEGDRVNGDAEFRINKKELDRVGVEIDLETTRLRFEGKVYKIVRELYNQRVEGLYSYLLELEVQDAF